MNHVLRYMSIDEILDMPTLPFLVTPRPLSNRLPRQPEDISSAVKFRGLRSAL